MDETPSLPPGPGVPPRASATGSLGPSTPLPFPGPRHLRRGEPPCPLGSSPGKGTSARPLSLTELAPTVWAALGGAMRDTRSGRRISQSESWAWVAASARGSRVPARGTG